MRKDFLLYPAALYLRLLFFLSLQDVSQGLNKPSAQRQSNNS